MLTRHSYKPAHKSDFTSLHSLTPIFLKEKHLALLYTTFTMPRNIIFISHADRP